jgi:anaerobic C4-dicarboxylate transporter
MAAPLIPDADRQCIANPVAACVCTLMGYMAAMNLQLFHLIETVIPVVEKTALATGIADQSCQILAASTVRQTRELPTRKLRPLTKLTTVP